MRWLLLMLICGSALAADNGQQQLDMLQSALLTCRQQITNANAWAQEQIAALNYQLQAAQKRITELEEAAKKK